MTVKPMVKLSENAKQHFIEICSHIAVDKPIEVYKNVTRKCLSIRQGGRVVLHTDYICLKNVVYKVSQVGRERVIREQKKNVHAFTRGLIVDPQTINEAGHGPVWSNISYDPYVSTQFHISKYDAEFNPHQSYIKRSKFADMMVMSSGSVSILAWECE